MAEPKSIEEDAEVGNNNIPKQKPPRWFQRSLTWRNSFSGMLMAIFTKLLANNLLALHTFPE